ncbi:protein O-mannosyl-transferase family [candidate division KSB1 bacterium]
MSTFDTEKAHNLINADGTTGKLSPLKGKYFSLFYLFGAVSFLVPLIVYIDTVSPTVSFWDCGEFIACSYTMGIPHPPGTPLYLLMGRLFSLLPIPGDIAFRVNLLSVILSAFTVLMLYLTIVHLIKKWWSNKSFLVYFSACVGALSFAFSDTFWFNAVEAEVYAVSMFLTALVLYLTILWMDKHEDLSSLRYLVFMVYILTLGIGLHLLVILMIPSILLLMIFANRKVFLNLNLWMTVPVLLIVGLSIYILIYMRSGMNPVIDENNPENLTNLWKYLNREQYGQESLFMTLFDRVAPFWEYQIKKMNLRYFGWNFIGEGITPGIDRGAQEILSLRGLYGLPFLLGIVGVFHHFKKDWKRALTVLSIFIITGIAITIYLNQPDPQPRERDYVYVGSYYAFAIWIGIGMQAIFELVKKLLAKNPNVMKQGLVSAGVLVFILVPFNMARFNYNSQDRSGNYLAWDYSYNILQSCEKNAIIFTNGDNDTFPLWYLQTVEGIRTDVDIACLSLLNADWYILQLKKQMGVDITLPDQQIETIRPFIWDKPQTISFDVSTDIVQKFYEEYNEEQKAKIDTEVSKISFQLGPTFLGRYLRVQDFMILHILFENKWKRPVYFAITVPDDSKAGLQQYLRLDGLAYKVVPFKNTTASTEHLQKSLIEKFKYRNLNNPDVYYDHQAQGLILNLRSAFFQMAYMSFKEGKTERAVTSLEKMDEYLPETAIPTQDFRTLVGIGELYHTLGKPDKMRERLLIALERYGMDPGLKAQIANYYQAFLNEYDTAENLFKEVLEIIPSDPRAYSGLFQIYEKTGNYQKGREVLEKWLLINPNDTTAKTKLDEFNNKLKNLNK